MNVQRDLIEDLAGEIPTQRPQMLTTQRGVLAQMLDCWLGCDCCGDEVICQALLDKLLFDLDRAIDLYALGSGDRSCWASSSARRSHGARRERRVAGPWR